MCGDGKRQVSLRTFPRTRRFLASQSEPFNKRELALNALLGFSYQETLFPQLLFQRRHERDSAWEEEHTLLREENGSFSGLTPKGAWIAQVWELAPFALRHTLRFSWIAPGPPHLLVPWDTPAKHWKDAAD